MSRLLRYGADVALVAAGITIGHGHYLWWIPWAIAGGLARALADVIEETP